MLPTMQPVLKETKRKSLNLNDEVIYAQRAFAFMRDYLYGRKGLLVGINNGSPKTAEVLFDGDATFTTVEYEALEQFHY